MRYIIWDFDGTLAERQGAWAGTLVEVAEAAGIAATANDFRPFLHQGFPWHTPEDVRPHGNTSEAWWHDLTP